MRLRFLAESVAVAALVAGCSSAAPLAPSPSLDTITVRVLVRGTDAPIVGATVVKDGVETWHTDQRGEVVVPVVPGVLMHIQAVADGYQLEGAWGSVGGHETWTFWLEGL